MYNEIQYLRIFGLDFAVFRALGLTQLYDSVMDSFCSFLGQAEKDGAAKPGMLEGYRRRQAAYMAAMRAVNDELYTGIGGTFAWLCGLDEDAIIAAMGIMELGGIVKFAEALVKSYKVRL